MRIALLDHAFAPGAKLDQFTEAARGAGAVVSFTGIVRDESGRLEALEIEHYPGMTERALQEIADQALARWDLADLLILHRHGRIRVGEPIMMVATAATHRAAAFEAAEFLTAKNGLIADLVEVWAGLDQAPPTRDNR